MSETSETTCGFRKCDLEPYARVRGEGPMLCRGHYAQGMRGSELHPLRAEDAVTRVVLSLRVSPAAKERAAADPDGARAVLERWALRREAASSRRGE